MAHPWMMKAAPTIRRTRSSAAETPVDWGLGWKRFLRIMVLGRVAKRLRRAVVAFQHPAGGLPTPGWAGCGTGPKGETAALGSASDRHARAFRTEPAPPWTASSSWTGFRAACALRLRSILVCLRRALCSLISCALRPFGCGCPRLACSRACPPAYSWACAGEPAVFPEVLIVARLVDELPGAPMASIAGSFIVKRRFGGASADFAPA